MCANTSSRSWASSASKSQGGLERVGRYAAPHLGRARSPQRRRLGVVEHRDEEVDGLVPQPAHGLGIEREGVCRGIVVTLDGRLRQHGPSLSGCR
jgi:hypothetical protein